MHAARRPHQRRSRVDHGDGRRVDHVAHGHPGAARLARHGNRALARRRGARACLRRARREGSSISSSYGSCSNDETVPNSASGVQLRLGALNAASMDINTACTSFLYALSTATAMIRTGVVRNAVVIGVELISQFMDWTNRGVAVLFGDGAAAVVLQATDREGRPDRREARLQRRRARHPARARHGNGVRASRRHAGRHLRGISTARRSSSARSSRWRRPRTTCSPRRATR